MKNFIKISLLLCIASMVFTNCNNDTPTTDKGVVINGVRWATRNVDKPGTFTKNPEESGMFYQWNSKVGWSSSDPFVNSNGGTEWNNNEPAGDWRQENDPCPCGWRLPTQGELEILKNVQSEWGALNGVLGRYFGSGEQRLFLPAAGNRDGSSGSLYRTGSDGYYWSSTPNGTYAYYMYFNSGDFYRGVNPIASGFSLRCVADK